jgi:hypothetical protein
MDGCNMTEQLIVNETLCFIFSHLGSVPSGNIHTVLCGFFSEDEIWKAKSCIHEVCTKFVQPVSDIPRLMKHKGDDKKKKDADDVIVLAKLFDEHKIVNVKFVALNLRRVPQIEPGSVDLCFLLESVDDMRKKIEELMGVKKQVLDLQTAVGNIANRNTQSLPSSVLKSSSVGTSSQNRVFSAQSATQPASASYAAVLGMKQDTNLQVNMPPLTAFSGSGRRYRAPPVIGSKVSDGATLKASQRPKEFHLYVGNLELDTTSEKIKDYIADSRVPIRLLSCEIVHSKRWAEPRALAAHVIVNSLDKDKALSADSWPNEIIVRPWRKPKIRDAWAANIVEEY